MYVIVQCVGCGGRKEMSLPSTMPFCDKDFSPMILVKVIVVPPRT